jgi:hypothetical protein
MMRRGSILHAPKQPPQPVKRLRDFLIVSKERMAVLWQLVRSTFLRKTPNFISVLTQSVPIPYTTTIRQGFQFKYRFRTKYQIKCIIMHPRVPWHEGRIRGGVKEGKPKETDVDDDHHHHEKGSDLEDYQGAEGSRKVKKVVPYTFVAADSSHTVRMWEATRSATGKPKVLVKLPTNIFQLVFIPALSIYCSSSDDKVIKVLFLNC